MNFFFSIVLMGFLLIQVNNVKSDCDESEVIVGSKCVSFKAQGPCLPGNWLVKNKNKKEKAGICKKNPGCDHVYWPIANAVLTKDEVLQNYCNGTHATVDVDYYGEGYCKCEPNTLNFPGGADCYELYQRGPCRINEVVTANAGTRKAECTVDKCFQKNRPYVQNPFQPNARSFIVSMKNTYAPNGGDGDCVKFGSKCGEENSQNGYQYGLHKESLTPSCIPHDHHATAPCVDGDQNNGENNYGNVPAVENNTDTETTSNGNSKGENTKDVNSKEDNTNDKPVDTNSQGTNSDEDKPGQGNTDEEPSEDTNNSDEEKPDQGNNSVDSNSQGTNSDEDKPGQENTDEESSEDTNNSDEEE